MLNVDGNMTEKHNIPVVCLPTLAPKDDHSSVSPSSSLTSGGSNVAPRNAPRSRTGCWTCRKRKVKCGEERPACAQCTRLGHACDYSLRLSFHDDTPRVVERTQYVSTLDCSVWDCKYLARASRQRQANQVLIATSPAPKNNSTGSAISHDYLPSFATLTTDEERERKAQCTSPGTYYVVMNPDSFLHLPEYSDDAEVKSLRLSPLRPGSLAAPAASSYGREALLVDGVSPRAPSSGDDTIVILDRFEDTTRRTTVQTKELRSPTSWRQSPNSGQPEMETYFAPDPANSLIPPPSFRLYPLGMDGTSIIYVEETDVLPIVLQLNYEVTVLATRLWLLAQELKQEASQEIGRIWELQELLQQLWVAANIMLQEQRLDLLPPRSQQLFQHASSLYQACMIFPHTSMWPGNQDAISAMEKSIGNNTIATRHALQVAYEQQR